MLVTEPWDQALRQLTKTMEMRGLHPVPTPDVARPLERLQSPSSLFGVFAGGDLPLVAVVMRERVRKEFVDPFGMLLPDDKLPMHMLLLHAGGAAPHWGRRTLDQLQAKLQGRLECFGVEEMAVPIFDTSTFQRVTVLDKPPKENCERMLDSDPLARRLGLSPGTTVMIEAASGYGPPCQVFRQVVS